MAQPGVNLLPMLQNAFEGLAAQTASLHSETRFILERIEQRLSRIEEQLVTRPTSPSSQSSPPPAALVVPDQDTPPEQARASRSHPPPSTNDIRIAVIVSSSAGIHNARELLGALVVPLSKLLRPLTVEFEIYAYGTEPLLNTYNMVLLYMLTATSRGNWAPIRQQIAEIERRIDAPREIDILVPRYGAASGLLGTELPASFIGAVFQVRYDSTGIITTDPDTERMLVSMANILRDTRRTA